MLQVAGPALVGGLATNVRTVTAATDTITIADYTVLANAASNAITETLPTLFRTS